LFVRNDVEVIVPVDPDSKLEADKLAPLFVLAIFKKKEKKFLKNIFQILKTSCLSLSSNACFSSKTLRFSFSSESIY